jgi:ComF family protein
MVDNYLGWIRRAVYPPACVFCNLPTGKDDLCTGCAADLAKNTFACSVCALPLQNPFDQTCGQCQQNPPHFDQCFAPYLYEYPLDRLIQRFKFRGDLRCGRILAGLLLESLRQRPVIIEAEALIPVPLHRRRLFERGFNQSRELARDIGKGLGLPLLDNQLARVRNTRAQSELGAGMRHANVRDAFAVRNPRGLPATVALIDDVMTTGSTVNECALCLKKAGVKQVAVWLIARAA